MKQVANVIYTLNKLKELSQNLADLMFIENCNAQKLCYFCFLSGNPNSYPQNQFSFNIRL